MSVQTKAIQLGKRNQITLPKQFIPDHVTMFECERRDDGAIVLTPHIAIPANQAYFWTARWQKGEREASRDIQEGRVTRFRKSADLFTELNKRRKQKK